MVFGWQRHSRAQRRAPAPLLSLPTPIAEEPSEMVPQFFPGYQPRMSTAFAATAVPGTPPPVADASPWPSPGRPAQRRAGSVRLAVDTSMVRTADPRLAQTASAGPCSPDAWRASFQSTATLGSPPLRGSALPRTASCHLPSMHQHHWLPETGSGATTPPLPGTRRAPPIAGLAHAPSNAASRSLATIAAEDEAPGTSGLERHESTSGQSVTRSNSSSSSRTLTAAPAQARGILKRTPPNQRSYHLPHRRRQEQPLQRNNTTKTVSHNDLSEDAEDAPRLLTSRSTDFTAGLAPPAAGARLFPDVSSKALVESVYLDYRDADDIKLAARLLPPTQYTSPQLAYLPPRTATLTVTNPSRP